MIPVDIAQILEADLGANRREPDGLLHASSDLVGSLRHSMLRAAGAPTIKSNLVSDVRMMTGTLWHKHLNDMLRDYGIPYMAEVKLDPWMSEGWSGTADWVFQNPETGKWVLGDLKTTKGEALQYLLRDGMKVEHKWQCSAYWYALEKMGLDMEDAFFVLYLPMNDTVKKEDYIQPLTLESYPVDQGELYTTMDERWTATERYLESEPINAFIPFDNEYLAPVMNRIQKSFWNKRENRWDVKLVPHWSAMFCPYPTELCNCNEQGTELIGKLWTDGTYVPRAGYEGVEVDPGVFGVLKRGRR